MARKQTYEIHDNGRKLIGGVQGQAEVRGMLHRIATSLVTDYKWTPDNIRADRAELTSPRGHATVYEIKKV